MLLTGMDVPTTNQPMPEKYNKLLFTPGPLNTSVEVREAMSIDMGSRDPAFIKIIQQTREQLLRLAGLTTSEADYTAIPMQGSGTFAIEAALGSLVPRESTLLVLINGAYGHRILDIARRLNIQVDYLQFDETQAVCPQTVRDYLSEHPEVADVALVHCETSTGMLNPLQEISHVVTQAKRRLLVDAMSSFGGMNIDLTTCPIDTLIASSNKCLQGAPGLGFVITRVEHLKMSKGRCHSLSLDLYEQWRGLERNGQFRFTPPTHVVLALHQAIEQLVAEGGVETRNQRYQNNQQLLMSGMIQLGFQAVLDTALQSPIISTFHMPSDPHFEFERFYDLLSERGCIIYPGKLSHTDCFRIGTIGDLNDNDITTLLQSIRECLSLMQVEF